MEKEGPGEQVDYLVELCVGSSTHVVMFYLLTSL